MDDNNKNIFDVLESPSSSTTKMTNFRKRSETTTSSSSMFAIRRSYLPLMNVGGEFYPSASSSPKPSSPGELQRKKRKHRVLQALDFTNPGPKNLVNVANVPARRPKTCQPTIQEKPTTSKSLYDESGLFIVDQTDRCDCNRFKCPGCFMSCPNCQSPKCGLECRNDRTYSYEYRVYGTNKEITQQ